MPLLVEVNVQVVCPERFLGTTSQYPNVPKLHVVIFQIFFIN